MAAIREAKKRGAKTLGIINVKESSISRECDYVLYTNAGLEIGVASTKAFTSQLTALLLLSLHFFHRKNKIAEELRKIPIKIEKVLQLEEHIKKISKEYANKQNTLFLGRGVNYPVALEGALKMKEISYIHAEGYPAAEMKHGPISLIDKNMPVVFIAVKDSSYDKILANVEEVKSRGGKVIIIATENDNDIKKTGDITLFVPKTNEFLSPLLTVIPLQLLAYYVAKERGCEIDKPRNLAKSVTVE